MPPPSLFNLSTIELRALHFFQKRTSLQLSGFHGCQFWNRIVLQIASRDNGVQHALIALASLHEEFEMGTVSTGNNSTDRFALTQYNLAIRHHLDQVKNLDGDASVETYLAPCLIFLCIEVHFSTSSPSKGRADLWSTG